MSDGRTADQIYAEFLRRCAAGESLNFEDCCAAHPDLEDGLQVLHSLRGKNLETLDLGPFEQRLERQFGAKITDRIDRAPGDPPSDSPGAGDSKPAESGDGSRYTSAREIGRGGMGAIYEVWDEQIKRRVAKKVMLIRGQTAHEDSTLGRELAARFLDEAQITGQLDHPGVVPVHELGIDEKGQSYFTMRLVKGRDLSRIFELAWKQEESWTRTRVVAVLAKVCEAVAYAHSKRVIHRDLKPANVMVGQFGEVYVMDWGLAKVLGEATGPDLEIRSKDVDAIRTRRKDLLATDPDSPIITMDGTVIGTPTYMPPEQAEGRIGELDERSDVYSIGAMLYTLLTKTLPYNDDESPRSPVEILGSILAGPPTPIHKLVPDVPAELSAICEKAMASRIEQRYENARALGEDLQSFLDRRVVRAYQTGAVAEFKKWVARNRGMASALAAAASIFVAGLVAVILLQQAGKRELLLNTDVYVHGGLRDRAENELWRIHPSRVDAMRDWLEDAKGLVARLELHRSRLEALRRKALPNLNDQRLNDHVLKFMKDDDELQFRRLSSLVEGLELFINPDRWKGHIASVQWRLERAETLEARSLRQYRIEWDRAIESLANPVECPEYGGFRLRPQIGLVPVGRDSKSGLWEFAVLETGVVPAREGGVLQIEDDSAMVLVLLPGATFKMGADRPSAGRVEGEPNIDPQARSNETPSRLVKLDPFFISKFEMTQGQWLNIAGRNPSQYPPDAKRGCSLRNPVEQVSREDCVDVLARIDLVLPTEAQWEYAARGGTTTVWWTGNDRDSLIDAVNLADKTLAKKQTFPSTLDWPDLDDGAVLHCGVGSYRANPFGIHDVCGNVWEWCQDVYNKSSERELRPGDGLFSGPETDIGVSRGSSFFNTALNARSSYRSIRDTKARANDLGLRAARSLTVR